MKNYLGKRVYKSSKHLRTLIKSFCLYFMHFEKETKLLFQKFQKIEKTDFEFSIEKMTYKQSSKSARRLGVRQFIFNYIFNF